MARILTALVRASKAGTFSGTGTATDTITVGSVVYTLRASVTTTANEVKVGATAAATATNLAAAINAGTGSGTLYGSLTVANPECTASVNSAVVTVSARTSGLVGNNIALAESGTGFSWAGAATALSGGVGQVEELIETQLTNLQSFNQLNASALRIVNDMLADLSA